MPKFRLFFSLTILLLKFTTVSSQNWNDAFQNAIKIYQKQDFVGAVEAYYKARDLAIKQGRTDDEMYFDLLQGMTGPMAWLGMISEQGEIIQETIDYVERKYGKSSLQWADCLQMKAYWHAQYSQDYLEAIRLFKEAYNIKKNFYPEGQRNPLFTIIMDLSWYNAILAKDHPELADLSFIKKSIELSRIADGEQSTGFAATLSNNALSYTYMDDYVTAIDYQSKAIKIIEGLNLEVNNELLTQLNIDYGIYQYKLFLKTPKSELLENAQRKLQMGIESFENLGTWRVNLPRYYKDLGLVFLKFKQFDQAKACFRKSLTIQQEFWSKDNSNNTYLLIEMGQGCLDAGLIKEGIEFYNSAIDILIKMIRNDFKYLSEQEKENIYYSNIAPAIETYNTIALLYSHDFPDVTGKLYNYRLATKGIILNNQEKIHRLISQSNNEDLKDVYRKWMLKRNLFSVKLTNEKVTTQSLDEIKVEIDQLERTLSENLHDQIFNNYVSYTWMDVKNKLTPTEAAIEIIRFRKYNNAFTDEIHYAALIVDKNKDRPSIVFLKNGEEMEGKQFINYRTFMLNYKSTDFNSELYKHYWAPIAEQIKDKERIYISKDGVYNLINLNTLYNTTIGNFLLNEKILISLSRTDDILAASKHEKIQNAFLFGRPTYTIKNLLGSGSEKEDDKWYMGNKRSINLKNVNWTDLPGTEIEVNAINNILHSKKINSNVYLKDMATESNLRKLINPQILHIATHGFFSGELMENKVTELGEVTFRGSSLKSQITEKNAMHNSGIVLSGVNSLTDKDPLTDDGVLTAYEATSLNLSNTELVVLSSCESGLGSLKSGEGVYGLQRAIKIAGVDALLISLWNVDDLATSSFMKTFYQTWLSGEGKSKAYLSAQKQLLTTYKHPYYWGAFELIGY